MHFFGFGNEKKRIHFPLPLPFPFPLVFWLPFLGSSIVNEIEILFFDDGICLFHLYRPIFRNSRAPSFVSRLVEISKNAISTENAIYGHFNRDVGTEY